ncbi:hypothetical protein GCM10009557_88110 [Virgisporangium ochraceum]|uniref:Pyrrolo-quinoline quinone repeat domain-containing protein n=1 Tax=Virgisporangium ochraceum TaxID=65505 RepID=A0A8J3ZTP2_9ACTN|nr:hypothetical protein Voc01_049240 [Virgisporangium ochraceum]
MPVNRLALSGALAIVVAGTASVVLWRRSHEGTPPQFQTASEAPVAASSAPPSFTGWSDPAKVGKPYGEKVPGLLTFRGNPTRTYYGTGPLPRSQPSEKWKFPRTGSMCSTSVDEKGPSQWCGSGWTGQPAVFEREGRTWVVFGAYDRKVHFLDAGTGEQILPDFPTGDIIKGSVTVDPDGYPIVYTGSRDNYYRAIAIDRNPPVELWKLSADAVKPTKWNNDWDGSGLVIDDYLFEGGENSQFHIVKLNRGYDANGKVTLAPRLVFNTPGWDDQLLKDIGHGNVSIENSVAIVRDVVYFANSGGLVQGWDLSGLKQGRAPTRVFRFWTGDDTDATIVADEQGMLYVGSEYEKQSARSKEVGQMMKLDPSKPDNPLVWKLDDRPRVPAGIWGTPALYKDLVIFDTTGGDVHGIDRATGTVRWTLRLPSGQVWQSPVVIDGVLVIGDCLGDLRAYDVSDTAKPPGPLWTLKVGGCIESTPAVWKGRMYVGTRAGAFHAIAA